MLLVDLPERLLGGEDLPRHDDLPVEELGTAPEVLVPAGLGVEGRGVVANELGNVPVRRRGGQGGLLGHQGQGDGAPGGAGCPGLEGAVGQGLTVDDAPVGGCHVLRRGGGGTLVAAVNGPGGGLGGDLHVRAHGGHDGVVEHVGVQGGAQGGARGGDGDQAGDLLGAEGHVTGGDTGGVGTGGRNGQRRGQQGVEGVVDKGLRGCVGDRGAGLARVELNGGLTQGPVGGQASYGGGNVHPVARGGGDQDRRGAVEDDGGVSGAGGELVQVGAERPGQGHGVHVDDGIDPGPGEPVEDRGGVEGEAGQTLHAGFGVHAHPRLGGRDLGGGAVHRHRHRVVQHVLHLGGDGLACLGDAHTAYGHARDAGARGQVGRVPPGGPHPQQDEDAQAGHHRERRPATPGPAPSAPSGLGVGGRRRVGGGVIVLGVTGGVGVLGGSGVGSTGRRGRRVRGGVGVSRVGGLGGTPSGDSGLGRALSGDNSLGSTGLSGGGSLSRGSVLSGVGGLGNLSVLNGTGGPGRANGLLRSHLCAGNSRTGVSYLGVGRASGSDASTSGPGVSTRTAGGATARPGGGATRRTRSAIGRRATRRARGTGRTRAIGRRATGITGDRVGGRLCHGSVVGVGRGRIGVGDGHCWLRFSVRDQELWVSGSGPGAGRTGPRAPVRPRRGGAWHCHGNAPGRPG